MLTIGQMARQLGVSVVTLRRWDRTGRLPSTSRTIGNHRRYTEPAPTVATARKTIVYARVSSHDQKPDLERQKQRLLAHAEGQGWTDIEPITDLGSGMNCRKTGLLRLLGMVMRGEAERVVVENKDRLLRFGVELVAWLCARQACDLVVVEQGASRSPEETLARDVLEVITVFSSRLYGARSAGRRHKPA
jgi:excisionase family DNA binding protein